MSREQLNNYLSISLAVGRLEARMDRAERDIRDHKREHRKLPRSRTTLKELAPYALALGLLFLVAIGKLTMAEAVQSLTGLRGQ